jgi:predicted nucleotidyltransferase
LVCHDGYWYIEATEDVLFDSTSMVEEAVIAAVKRYLAALPGVGIHARRAVLFGSSARGQADQYSDIDLIVIAPEFDASREISLIKALWLATASADNRIEPIPCGEKEWETEQGRPILEIARREGIVIAA